MFLFGSFLEQRTLNKTRLAIKELIEMAPESAFKEMENGEFLEVLVDEVHEGDRILVKTGGKVPVDGIVVEGTGSINEASITGESLPVSKEIESNVYAGTILDNGTLKIIANKVGEDTTFGKIIELVEEAQDSKSEAERFIDKFSKYYTPAVLILGIIVYLVSRNLELAITILVLGCPGALVIGVPVSNVAGIGNGAKHGILLKGSEVIGDFSKIDSFVFDKTGTLTIGKPSVSKKIFFGEKSEDALDYLASIERESNHPLGFAILEDIKDFKIYPVSDTSVFKGGGIVASVDNHKVAVGNLALMESEKIPLNNEQINQIRDLEKYGNSIVLTAVDNKLKIIMN